MYSIDDEAMCKMNEIKELLNDIEYLYDDDAEKVKLVNDIRNAVEKLKKACI